MTRGLLEAQFFLPGVASSPSWSSSTWIWIVDESLCRIVICICHCQVSPLLLLQAGHRQLSSCAESSSGSLSRTERGLLRLLCSSSPSACPRPPFQSLKGWCSILNSETKTHCRSDDRVVLNDHLSPIPMVRSKLLELVFAIFYNLRISHLSMRMSNFLMLLMVLMRVTMMAMARQWWCQWWQWSWWQKPVQAKFPPSCGPILGLSNSSP